MFKKLVFLLCSFAMIPALASSEKEKTNTTAPGSAPLDRIASLQQQNQKSTLSEKKNEQEKNTDPVTKEMLKASIADLLQASNNDMNYVTSVFCQPFHEALADDPKSQWLQSQLNEWKTEIKAQSLRTEFIDNEIRCTEAIRQEVERLLTESK